MFTRITYLFAFSILLFGCGEDVKIKTVRPVSEFLIGGTVPKESDQVNSAVYYDYGFSFSASKAGKITQVGIALPSDDTYTVSVWDGVSKSLINQYSVTQTTPGSFVYKAITPLEILANRKYFISVLANDYSRFFTTPNTDFMPFTKGPVTIHHYSYDYYDTYPVTLGFPDTAGVTLDYFAGPLDFTFEYEE